MKYRLKKKNYMLALSLVWISVGASMPQSQICVMAQEELAPKAQDFENFKEDTAVRVSGGKETAYWSERVVYTLTSTGVTGTCIVTAENARICGAAAIVLSETNDFSQEVSIECSEVGVAKINMEFVPEDTESYGNPEAVVKEIAVSRIPVEAAWTGLEKTYDKSPFYFTAKKPVLTLPEDLEGFELPMLMEETHYGFKISNDETGAGDWEAVYQGRLVLQEEYTAHYELKNPSPAVSISVLPIKLTADDIAGGEAAGKKYDGSSKAKFVRKPVISSTKILEGDTELSLSYEADYYLDGKKTSGNAEENVKADSVRISDLRVLENKEESSNYIFEEGAVKEIEDSFLIERNEEFLEFCGSADALDQMQPAEGVYWFSQDVSVQREGFTFSDNAEGPFAVNYHTSWAGENGVKTIYAKNGEGLISRGLRIGYDTMPATAAIYAGVDGGNAETISRLLDQYTIIGKNSTISISVRGNDRGSRVKKIQWYSSDIPLQNDASTWPETAKKELSFLVTEEGDFSGQMDLIDKTEVKKYYYVKITDHAGNVAYISSEGVLQDNKAPVISSLEICTTADAEYEGRGVYSGDISFALKLRESGTNSGIADVKAILYRTGKREKGDRAVIREYSDAQDKVWIPSEKLHAIQNLKREKAPGEAVIKEASTEGEETLDISGVLTEIEEGNYYILTVTAYDKAGNESIPISVEFIKDSAGPVITVTRDLEFNDTRISEDLYTGGKLTIEIKDMTLVTENKKLLTGISVFDEGPGWTTEFADDGREIRRILLEFGERSTYGENVYFLKVFAEDSRRNGPVSEEQCFTIDYTGPVYEAEYSAVDENAVTQKDICYYNRDIVASFSISEDTTYDERLLKIIVKNETGETVAGWEKGMSISEEYCDLIHEPHAKDYKLRIKADLEDHVTDDEGYRFYIEGQDRAGNPLTAADPTMAGEVNKKRAMDTVMPELTRVKYDTLGRFRTVSGRDYVNRNTQMTFFLKERHPAESRAFITSEGEKKYNWTAVGAADEYRLCVLVPQRGEKGDEQLVTLDILDLAGNKAVMKAEKRSEANTVFREGMFQDKFIVDKVKPVIKYEYLKFRPDNQNVDGADYFKRDIAVRITVEEHNFQSDLLPVSIRGFGEGVAYDDGGWKQEGDRYTRIFTYTENSRYDMNIKGIDCAGNPLALLMTENATAVENHERGETGLSLAVDKENPVIIIKPSKVKNTAEGRGKYNGYPLYNKDAVFEVMVYDPLSSQYSSGIHRIIFSASGEDGTSAVCAMTKEGVVSQGKGMKAVLTEGNPSTLARGKRNQYVFQVVLAAEIFNTNGIVLSVEACDVSQNRLRKETVPFSIDTTKPVVRITYDNEEVSNRRYFHNVRKASVRVTERNFSKDCLEFTVNGKNVDLEFELTSEGTGNRDDAVWKAEYLFAVDGDYMVDCTCEDRTGNKGEINFNAAAPKDFTIDRKAPVITVVFNKNNPLNPGYFSSARVATITVEEHNFSADEVQIVGTASNAGASVVYPVLGSWSREGDTSRATLTFSQDALYTLDVACYDLAANPAISPGTNIFTVDNTDPEIIVGGVEDNGVYTGEVLPRIRFRDNNYESHEILLIRTAYESHDMDVSADFVKPASVSVDENGRGTGSSLIEDLPYEEGNDGIYTLKITVRDKAGRSTEKNIVYSVNRFGSVYIYSDDLSALLGGYHQKISGELYITVYNANRLLKDSVKLEILRDGARILEQKSSSDTDGALQENTGWFKYRFTLRKEDFAEDGFYMIVFSDKDEAGNTRTNSRFPIQFHVDGTKPVLDSVTGLEHSSINADEQLVRYVLSDSMGLKQIVVYVNGKEVSRTEKFEKQNLYEGTFLLGEGMDQRIRIVAEDRAGNILDTKEPDFETAYPFNRKITISKNPFVRWYSHKIQFWGTVVMLSGTAAVLFILLAIRRKKEQSEES